MTLCWKLKRVILLSDDSSPDSIKDDSSHKELDEEEIDVAKTKSQVPSKSRFMASGELDFNFIAYEEKILIVGASGSGKTYLANVLLKSLNGISVWV